MFMFGSVAYYSILNWLEDWFHRRQIRHNLALLIMLLDELEAARDRRRG